MERTEERISKLKDKTTEINQSEHQRENRPEKINMNLRKLNKVLTFLSQEP